MNAKEQLMLLISGCDNKRSVYFNGLLRYVPEAIAEESQFVRVKQGERIIMAGEPCEYVYFVLSGDVKGVDYNQTGEAYSFMDFTDMYIVGDFEVLSYEHEYVNTIYAAKDCRLLRISAMHYLNWIKNDENALFLRLNNILGIMINERKLDRFFLHKGCKERVINYLIHYYEKHRNASSGKIRIALTQNELADKVGSNLRSVQRVVAAMKNEQLISVENRKMMLSYEQYLKLVEIEKQKG